MAEYDRDEKLIQDAVLTERQRCVDIVLGADVPAHDLPTFRQELARKIMEEDKESIEKMVDERNHDPAQR